MEGVLICCPDNEFDWPLEITSLYGNRRRNIPITECGIFAIEITSFVFNEPSAEMAVKVIVHAEGGRVERGRGVGKGQRGLGAGGEGAAE